MKNTALITGASSGLGKEFAIIHAKTGGDIVIVARSESKLNNLKDELTTKYGVEIKVIVKDLTQPNSRQEIHDELKGEKIDIDILINNAGFGGIGKFHERQWESDKNMIELNITALTELTRLFLPNFVQKNSGRILNISSTASLMPGPMQAVYFATKAYVTSFSNAIAEELHDSDVTVTALLPGATETDFGKVSGMDKTKLFAQTADAHEVAQAGYNGMLKGDINVISGLTFPQKIMMKALPFAPLKMKLKMIRERQEIK